MCQTAFNLVKLCVFLIISASPLTIDIAKASPTRYAPVAICQTGGTHIPYPYYVCCKKIDKKGLSWQQKWVPTDCKNADPMAVLARGCRPKSPVYSTGLPIMGECQFSWLKMKYKPVYNAKI